MSHDQGRPRLAELLAALSLATDLGLGQPMEHVMRSCLISMRLAQRLGMSDEERAEVYYVALLAWVGCMADSTETSTWFGDDIAMRGDAAWVDDAPLPMLWFLIRRAGAGSSPLRRARLMATLMADGWWIRQSMAASCQVTSRLAEQLGLGDRVRRSLTHVFARWDGRGVPEGLEGEAIDLSVRLLQLADLVVMVHRVGGVEAAVDVAEERRGSYLDPTLVDEFARAAQDLLPGLVPESTWDEVIDSEPALTAPLTDPGLDVALESIADFTDLKSVYFSGHSRGVADLAAAAGRHAGLPGKDVVSLRRAGLLHDVGRSGVPNTIWDKPEPLSASERERARLHVYYTERILARIPTLARAGAIAAAHHERIDGSGYHRGVSAGAIGAGARLLAAADAYQAMTQRRPHRPALAEERAAAELRAEVRSGRLAGDAVEAVLDATGHARPRRPTMTAGLTPREVEVLTLLGSGATNREIAARLGIAAKTVGNHVEHVYTKIGVSTRPGATLFAVQHGLLDGTEPLGR